MSARAALASIALLAALGVDAAPAYAEPPAGDYTIAVSSPELLVPTSLAAEACTTADRITLCLDDLVPVEILPGSPLPLFNGSGVLLGRLTGRIEGDLAADPIQIEIFSLLRGRASASLAGRMRFGAAGGVEFGGTVLATSTAGKLRCATEAVGDTLACRGSAKLCAFESNRSIGCVRWPLEFAVQGESGPWQLRLLDLATDERGGVRGKAEVELSTGLILGYDVKGRYDARRDVATLLLAGSGVTGTSRLKLSRVTLGAGAVSGGTLVFRIGGQNGKIALPGGGAP